MFDYSIVQICQILIALFLGIVMIQSGVDKIIDWNGNQSFLVEHFSKTFLSKLVNPLLLSILILEIVAGVFCLFGSFNSLMYNDSQLIKIGFILVAIDLIALVFGQRIAKDYVGAAVLVNYFILAIIGLLTFAL
tara:strand:+ start:70 stop:471 length:402 start_codon:yes stop_codon:yes gene_type:complete